MRHNAHLETIYMYEFKDTFSAKVCISYSKTCTVKSF